jgi:prepilin-type N-terminal cleavage/methylation domain-containing protein/prepilin-type processing-associated H-X9-DG protein
MVYHGRSRGGFTLIELLVVVAIIVILAGLLFPVFALAREKARQTSCLSNARQIGQAIMMYADSYDHAYPLYAHAPNHDQLWYEVIEPYIKNSRIFCCPTLPRKESTYPAEVHPWAGYGVNYTHVIKYGPGWPNSNPKTAGPVLLEFLARPAETIMIADAQANKGKHAGMGWPAIYCPVDLPDGVARYRADGLEKTWALSDRHNGGGNYVFADGHVKWMRRDAVINWSRERGKELWGHYAK